MVLQRAATQQKSPWWIRWVTACNSDLLGMPRRICRGLAQVTQAAGKAISSSSVGSMFLNIIEPVIRIAEGAPFAKPLANAMLLVIEAVRTARIQVDGVLCPSFTPLSLSRIATLPMQRRHCEDMANTLGLVTEALVAAESQLGSQKAVIVDLVRETLCTAERSVPL